MNRLLLFPGAGSASTHPGLVAIEAAVAPTPCVRADFPYRKAGRKAPDRAPVLLQAVRDEAAPLLAAGDTLVLGGRSMGGRICSLAVGDATDPLPAKGLVLICYPLHPPGKPEKSRADELVGALSAGLPVVVIQGERDPFGTPAQVLAATSLHPPDVYAVPGTHTIPRGSAAAVGAAVTAVLGGIPG